jgi:hypothetical protein
MKVCMPPIFLQLFIGLFLSVSYPSVWAAEDSNCKKDSEGNVWCAPEQGGIGQRPNGEVFCGVGKCINMTNGAVVCSNQPDGRTTLNYIGQAICTGTCVPGKQSVCVQAK